MITEENFDKLFENISPNSHDISNNLVDFLPDGPSWDQSLEETAGRPKS